MAVHAHPDDEASKGAATMAKYVAEGVDVMVVTCTGGERGDVLHKAAEDEVREHGIAEVRKREMAKAAEILGVRHVWLGYEDSGWRDPEIDPPPPLPEGCFADLPIEVELVPMVRLLREFRPQVVTTYDENGGYPHPDHLRVHALTMAAIDAAADPSYPSDLEPWTVSKVYYNMQFARARVYAMHQYMVETGVASQYTEWIERMEARPDESHRITTSIPVGDYFPQREAALLAHRTQVDPASQWFAVPSHVQARIWPTEEFELARSLVPTELPENDLFAGLRDDAAAR